MTAPAIDIQALAREIAMRMAPDALLDAEDVGAYLKVTARYVQEQYAGTPGFPTAIRLTGPDGRRGNARWRRKDITAWIEGHLQGKTTKGGRPRNTARV